MTSPRMVAEQSGMNESDAIPLLGKEASRWQGIYYGTARWHSFNIGIWLKAEA